MNHIKVTKFGLAIGIAATLYYFACALVFMIGGRDVSIQYLNSILHGVDVSPILKESMTVGELCISLIDFFVITTLIGATVAAIYNWLAFDSSQKRKTESTKP